MGKVQILSGGTEGLYNVRILKETAKAALRKTALEARLTALLVSIAVKETEFNAAVAEFEAKKLALTNAIAEYNAGTITMDDVKKAQAAMLATYSDSVVKQKAYNRLSLEITSIRKQLEMIESIFTNEDRAAWCADLTEDLAGEVGSIEVDGEKDEIILMPGPTHLPGLGMLQESAAGTPAGVFYNWAVRAGWQKFKPTYRIGTITSLDGDICNVNLFAAASTDQNLNINQTETLSNVPIEYMSCNGAAFEVGDEVLIEFTGQNWNAPKVMGFRTNPQACGMLWVINYYEGPPLTRTYGAMLIRFKPGANQPYEVISDVANPNNEVNRWTCTIFGESFENAYDNKMPLGSTYFNGIWYHLWERNASEQYGGECTLTEIGSFHCNGVELGGYRNESGERVSSYGMLWPPVSVITNAGALLWVCLNPIGVFDSNFNELASYTLNNGSVLDGDGNEVGSIIYFNPSTLTWTRISSMTGVIVSWRRILVGGVETGYLLSFSNGYAEFWPASGKQFYASSVWSGVNEAYDPDI